ncbi:hypothetical protein [Streptomyces werraensis]|uniref:hypothetical protein n=1 Tax=Streptomyces werraensis TaxID=68284 RepID=UPI003447900E
MTNPGQSTPWARIPVPSEGKIPDVPVDLAAVADAVDTILKNVIGGATAPAGPLQPSVIDASASIGSLNETQSAQQNQITTLQGQINALNATPWAGASSRPTQFTMPGNTKTPQLVHSHQVPTFNERRLLLAYATANFDWSSTSVTASLRAHLQLRPDGSTAYEDRNLSVQTGNEQHHSLFFLETVDAGQSVRVGLSFDVYGSATSSVTARTQAARSRIYVVALPWSTGPAVTNPAL